MIVSENPLGHCRLFQPKLEKAIADLHADRYLSSEADKFFVRLGQSLAAMKRQRPIEAQQERRPGEQPNPARREQQPITEKDFRALARILREEELSPKTQWLIVSGVCLLALLSIAATCVVLAQSGGLR